MSTACCALMCAASRHFRCCWLLHRQLLLHCVSRSCRTIRWGIVQACYAVIRPLRLRFSGRCGIVLLPMMLLLLLLPLLLTSRLRLQCTRRVLRLLSKRRLLPGVPLAVHMVLADGLLLMLRAAPLLLLVGCRVPLRLLLAMPLLLVRCRIPLLLLVLVLLAVPLLLICGRIPLQLLLRGVRMHPSMWRPFCMLLWLPCLMACNAIGSRCVRLRRLRLLMPHWLRRRLLRVLLLRRLRHRLLWLLVLQCRLARARSVIWLCDRLHCGRQRLRVWRQDRHLGLIC